MMVDQLDIEFFFLILVRVSGFIFTAPLFSLGNIPRKVKTGLSISLSLILVFTIPANMPEYGTTTGYAILVVKEAMAGALMGLFANIAYHVLAFAGQIIDMEIGFSMVNQMDPVSRIQTTITSNLYGYLVLLMMVITDLHHFFLKAMVDSFQVISVGEAMFRPNMYMLMVTFIIDYFLLAFRIILPVFASILLVNTILGILAKIAPQMNMFVIGMQLKVFIGLSVLLFIIQMIPSVSDVIFNKMMEMLRGAVSWMT